MINFKYLTLTIKEQAKYPAQLNATVRQANLVVETVNAGQKPLSKS